MTDLLLLPGDGIGPEVTAQVRRVAERLTPDLKIEERLFGGASYDADGSPLTDETLAAAAASRDREAFAALRQRGRFMVALDAHQYVCIEGGTLHSRGVPIHQLEAGDLGDQVRIPAQETRHVHHLSQSEHPLPPGKPQECLRIEDCPAPVIRCCRDARGEHQEEVDREERPAGEHVLESCRAEYVRDLVRIRHDGRGTVSRNHPCEFERGEKGRLDVNVRVDQAGNHP